MSAVFLKLLNMSIAAGWLVAAVIILRLCLKKAPKAIHCALWALVAIRLLCPFSLESSLSLIPEDVANGNAVSEWTDAYVGDVHMFHDNTAQYDAAVAAGREPIYAGEGHYYVVTAPDQLGAPSTIENTVVPVLSWVWLAGVVALLLYAAISYLRICTRVKVSLNWKDNIWRSEQVDSPFILGVFSPKIYLPFDMDEVQMDHVIAHEQAHLRRRDHWWKPLGFILLAVYWFNPLMWVAYILFCRDIELACDEKVIRDMGAQDKKAYSEALLACSVPRRMIAACPLAFGEVGVKKRIASVLDYKKPAFWTLIVALTASAAVAVCFMTSPFSSEDVAGMLAANPCDTICMQPIDLIVLQDSSDSGLINITNQDEIAEFSDLLKTTAFKKTFKRFRVIPDTVAANITFENDEGAFMRMLMLSSRQAGDYDIYVRNSDGYYLEAVDPEKLNFHIISLVRTKLPHETDLFFADAIWNKMETSTPIETLAHLCKLNLWNDSIEEEPQISIPGNFGPHALFSGTPNDADALDVAMARRAFLLMRLYPEEVSCVTWSYPDAGGKTVLREFFADELSAILSLNSDTRVYKTPTDFVDVARLITFLNLDEKLFLRYAAEGNAFSPLLEAQENAVWFTPEDIHDIEYMELVWHDGQRFTPLTQEGYEYVQTRLSSAKEIGAAGCPYHSVLYIHRADGVVGKILPAEDSCDVFQSDGKYYQFGDRANPPYSDSNETFYNHFGTSTNDLPHYVTVPDTTEPGTIEQYEFSDILGCSGYVISDGGSPWEMRTYYAVAGDQEWPIAETFGFGEAEDYVVDLDGDGITELVANVTFGGDGARRAYVYQRRGDEIYLGTLSAEGLPNFDDWGANSTWSEYEPSTGIFRLHYAQKGSEDYGVFETKGLERFQFDVFSPAPPRANSPSEGEPHHAETIEATVAPIKHSQDTLAVAEWTVTNSLSRQYRAFIPNTQTLDVLLVEADPIESARAAASYFQRNDDLALTDPTQASQLIAVKAVYYVDWFLNTESNQADAGAHAAYYYLIPHVHVAGRWAIHDIVPTSIPQDLELPRTPSTSDAYSPISLKSYGSSDSEAAAQLNAQVICTTDVPVVSSIYHRSGDTSAQFLVTQDGRAGELPLPYMDDNLTRAKVKNSHLDLNYHIYYYEAEVPEAVADPNTGKILAEAGTYRYFVDMAAFRYLMVFVPDHRSVEAPARSGEVLPGGAV